MGVESMSLGAEKIDLRPLGSWRRAFGDFSRADLERTMVDAEKLRLSVNRLKKVPIVQELVRRGIIGADDLLARTNFPSDSHFDGIRTLVSQAEKILGDPRQPLLPDFREDLSRLFQFIYQTSGRRYDEHVAKLLTNICGKPYTQRGLIQLRQRMKVSDRETK